LVDDFSSWRFLTAHSERAQGARPMSIA
jgi:hypothetical protein